MRTTLDLDEHVLRKAKQVAAREGKTLTRLIEEIIPGVNLADRDALYERMEGRG